MWKRCERKGRTWRAFDEGTIKFFINFRHHPIFREKKTSKQTASRRRGKEIAFHRFALFYATCGSWFGWMQFMFIVFCFFSESWRFNRYQTNGPENEDIDQRGLIFTTQNILPSEENHENLNTWMIRLRIHTVVESPQFTEIYNNAHLHKIVIYYTTKIDEKLTEKITKIFIFNVSIYSLILAETLF